MKGLICYYSGSGNTKLACEYLASKVKAAAFEFHDVVRGKVPVLSNYAVVGFATFTDFWGMPYLMQRFIHNLPKQDKRPAFVFNTFGMMSAGTQNALRKALKHRGFKVLGGYSLHTPENYPPMINGGMAQEQFPQPKDMEHFHAFLKSLNQALKRIGKGEPATPFKSHITFLDRISPSLPRSTARKDMGEKFVDQDLCTKCRTCEKGCPYHAIQMNPYPMFDMTKCYGCWACFNHCPSKAIYTKKHRGRGHYPRPIPQFLEKLKT